MIGFEFLREINIYSILLRLGIAVLFSGIIGADRGKNHRPAGFRTHILVCLGSTLVMITSQYMRDILGSSGDMARLGAQVISGIGFLGAGTIIVVGKNQVKGLTTAACLWACACMGLAIGIGFYEGAVIAFIFTLITVRGLHSLDLYTKSHSSIISLYIEIYKIDYLNSLLTTIKDSGAKITCVEIVNPSTEDNNYVGISMRLIFVTKQNHKDYVLYLYQLEGVYLAEEVI